MQIKEVATMAISQRIAGGFMSFKFGTIETVESLILRITSESGEQGYGVVETTSPLGLPSSVAVSILGVFKEAIIGGDPRAPRSTLAAVRRRLLGLNYAIGPIYAAIDGALHDLASREAGVSMSNYLGGPAGGTVDTVDVVPFGEDQYTRKFLESCVERGGSGIKLKLTGEADSDIERVKKAREIVGVPMRLVCDANGSFGRDTAKIVASALEEQRVEIFEQPLNGGDLEGMTELVACSPIAIEADESVCSINEAINVIELKAANCLSFRVSRFGGIENTIHTATRCVENGMSFRFGAMFTPSVQNAISTHLALALPEQRFPHELSMHEQFLDDPFEGLRIRDGRVVIDQNCRGTGLRLKSGHDNFLAV